MFPQHGMLWLSETLCKAHGDTTLASSILSDMAPLGAPLDPVRDTPPASFPAEDVILGEAITTLRPSLDSSFPDHLLNQVLVRCGSDTS